MANKFLHYRKNPAAGGIYTEGGSVLKDVSGVVGVYDTAEEVPQNMDNQWETFTFKLMMVLDGQHWIV